MGVEIERKFLLRDATWRPTAEGILYRQGYLSTSTDCCVRVRITGQQEAWLTVKGPLDTNSRLEYEYPIPVTDAMEMLEQLCQGGLIEKIRYRIPHGELVWEVDEFTGANIGLIIAEVELAKKDQQVLMPHWVGEEVTTDKRYYNAYLALHPFNTWGYAN